MIFRYVFWAMLFGLLLGGSSAYLQTRNEEPEYHYLISGTIPASKPVLPSQAQRIVVENGNDFDFEVMELGETKKHVFQLRNNTEKPVRLSILETTCKCTVGSIPKESIPPGALADVTLEWTAKAYAPDFRQSATLRSDDEIEQLISLSVHGDVLEVIHAEPMAVAFSDVSFGSTRTQEITVVAFDHAELVLDSMEWLDPTTSQYFECQWQPMPAERLTGKPKPLAGLMGTLVLKPGMPMGPFREELTLKLTSSKSRTIGIPIEGRIITDVSVFGVGYRESTSVLDLGVIPVGEGLTRRLRITVKGERRNDFKITNIVAEPADALIATAEESTSGTNGNVRTFLLEVQVNKDAKPMSLMGIQGRRAGRLMIETTDPIASQIKIEVRFAVLEEDVAGTP